MKNNLTLKQWIINEVTKREKGFSEILAKIAGYSSGSSLMKVVRDDKKEFEKFEGLIKLVNYLAGSEAVKMMTQFAKEVDVNKKTARNLLEYFVSNAEYEAFNNLLDRMDEASNKESKEYAKIYRMQYKYKFATSYEEYNRLIREISEVHVTFPELKVYKSILINYCYFEIRDYDRLKFMLKEIEEEVELIENDFIKEMFLIRIYEVKAYTYLKAYNKPEIARECCDWIINSNAANGFKAYASYLKGHSYMFSSFENAIDCYEKSIELYNDREHDVKWIREEIEFIKVYWDKEIKHKYVNSEALYQVKKGNISLDDYNLTPEFRLYLEGYSAKNDNKLLLSMIGYIKNKDLFLANLAKIELIKNGYNQEVISAMISMNVA